MRKVVDIASIIALNSLSTTIWIFFSALFICKTNKLVLFLNVCRIFAFSLGRLKIIITHCEMETE